jgi:hypothetical protein
MTLVRVTLGVLLPFLQKTTTWKALDQGRSLYLCRILKAMKSGKRVALRKEQGLFCILFVAAWTKRMASGGTPPAGSAFNSQQRHKEQQINDLLLPLMVERKNIKKNQVVNKRSPT